MSGIMLDPRYIICILCDEDTQNNTNLCVNNYEKAMYNYTLSEIILCLKLSET